MTVGRNGKNYGLPDVVAERVVQKGGVSVERIKERIERINGCAYMEDALRKVYSGTSNPEDHFEQGLSPLNIEKLRIAKKYNVEGRPLHVGDLASKADSGDLLAYKGARGAIVNGRTVHVDNGRLFRNIGYSH